MTDEYDLAFSVHNYCMGIISIALNFLVLWLVKFNTTEAMSEYRIFLANLAITDTSLAVLGVALQPKMLFRRNLYVMNAIGPMNLLNADICYYATTLMICIQQYSNMCFPLLFVYRYTVYPFVNHAFLSRYVTSQAV